MSILFSAEIVGIVESIVAGTVQVVIIIPKHAVRKALPTIAGLKILAPSPPKTILPIAMQKTLPITAAKTGSFGGSDSASIMPVTTALRSRSDSKGFSLWRIKLQIHSVATEPHAGCCPVRLDHSCFRLGHWNTGTRYHSDTDQRG